MTCPDCGHKHLRPDFCSEHVNFSIGEGPCQCETPQLGTWYMKIPLSFRPGELHSIEYILKED